MQIGHLIRLLAVVSSAYLAADAHAQFFCAWDNPLGGAYNSSSNWDCFTGVPGVNDGAGFGLNNTYIVTFPSNQTTGTVSVSNGFVSFFMGSSGTNSTLNVPGTLAVTGAGLLSVRDGEINPGNIIVSNGGELDVMSTATVVAPDGTMTVTGNGSTWTHANPIRVGDSGTGVLLIEAGADVASDVGAEGQFSGMIAASGGSTGNVTVTGAGSTWTNIGGLSVGNDGEGTLLIAGGGGVSNDLDGSVATLPGSVGEVTVDGAGSMWTSVGALFNVGDEGNGTLDISDGGVVSGGTGNISRMSGSVSSVTVDGDGSLLSLSSSLGVGTRGEGTLNITGGGDVSNTGAFIGSLAGSVGTATIRDEGSTWTNTGTMFVGNSGSGELTVETGADVTSTPSRVGYNPGATGDVVVTGTGSTWDAGSSLWIGVWGDGTLAIDDGAVVTSASGIVGFDPDSTGATGIVTIDGAGSNWTIGADLDIGITGPGTVNVSNGGTLTNGIGMVGEHPGSVGTVSVTGAGSNWTCSDFIQIGRRGSGSLTIEDGGSVDGLFYCNIGGFNPPAAATGTVIVDGPGSTLTIGDALNVGFVEEGTLSITNGGTVESMFGLIGRLTNSTGTAMVSGAGSSWTTNNVLIIGDRGQGALLIEDGATVENTLSRIGRQTNGDGTVTVTGANSTWTSTDELRVGWNGEGSLSVEDGALLETTDVFVGMDAGSIGDINIIGTGTNWSMSGRLSIGGDAVAGTNGGAGSVTINSGTTVNMAQDVVVFPDGLLQLQGGVLDTAAVSFNGGGAFQWNAGTLHVNVFHADLTIPFGGTLAPGDSAGSTTVVGDYTQMAGAKLQMEIGGPATSTQHDFVQVTGTALVGGDLETSLIDGFLPCPDDEFIVLTAALPEVLGSFANAGNGQRVDTTDGNGSFIVHYGPTSAFDENRIVLSDFERSCAADVNQSGTVDVNDLLVLLAAWGPCPAPCPPACAADINGDCEVNVTDLLALLAAWGGCS